MALRTQKKKRRLPRWLKGCLLLALSGVLALVACNIWMVLSTKKDIVTELDDAPFNRVGLVLGTSRSVNGTPNLHFTARIEAAARLYREGKVQCLIVSGDNGSRSYNEPRDMTRALVKAGVPDEAILQDFAGFRTLDSMFRAKKVFGLDRLTVISDPFHLPRAIFLGRKAGIEVTGFAGDKIAFKYGARSELRECAARVKALLDIYVLDTKPKFLGEPVPVTIPGVPQQAANF